MVNLYKKIAVLKSIKLLLKKIDIDSAVLFTLISKFWSVVTGPLTSVVIALHFTSVIQGFYFTFNTLLSLQIFIELGLGSVIQLFVSHEWSKLEISSQGKLHGDENSISRLRSISQLSVKWFIVGSIITMISLIFIGVYFFSTSSKLLEKSEWIYPWISLALLTGISIVFTPFWSILEGCNQLKKLYKFRVLQSVIFTFVLIVSIISGARLWAAPFASLFSMISSIFFLRTQYFSFFKDIILENSSGPVINWRKDILPMQWRVAISWISNYFSFYLFTPILFKYQGASVAGKFGMSWNIALAIGSFSSSWMISRTPQFSILVAKKNYEQLDKLLWRMFKIILVSGLLLSLLIWGSIYILSNSNMYFFKRITSRLLDPIPFLFLLIGQLFFFISTPFSTYLRAHKKEPLMFFSLFLGFTISIMAIIFSKYMSVHEVTLGYLIISIIAFPILIKIWASNRVKFKNTK